MMAPMHADHAAAENGHDVFLRDLGPAHGVEAHAQGLDQGAVADGKSLGHQDFPPGDHEEFPHGAVPLDAQRLVELAGIGTAVPAGGAVPAGRVRVDGDGHAGTQRVGNAGADGGDLRAHFVARDHAGFRHRVPPAPGVQIAPAEPDIPDPQQYFAFPAPGLLDIDHVQFERLGNLDCFHNDTNIRFLPDLPAFCR